MGSELIRVAQNPVIEYSALDRIAAEVDKRLSIINVSALVIDEDNVKSIKTLRTELKKEFDSYEDARKSIKQTVMNPYEAFEADYKAKIASKYKDADATLKAAIDNVEGGIKAKKAQEVKEYFDDYAFVKNIDFVTFEQTGIVVGLTDSLKSLKDNARQFIDNIVSDLDVISTQPHQERIIVRYKKSLNVREAISTVLREVEQEKALMEAKAKIEIKPETPVVEVPIQLEIKEPEELLTVSFTVTATKKQIIALRNYMKGEGIQYE